MPGPSERYVPRPPLRYDLIGSTQDIARALVRPGGDYFGAVVTARRSSAARGRQGRAWHVPPGANVCLTTVLPPVPLAEAWKIALVAGVSVAEGIRRAVPSAAPLLRFPNDVQLGGGKVAGVLVESVPEPGAASTAGRIIPLLGVGVNVHAAPLPEEIAARATSLEAATGVSVAVEAVEAALLERLSVRWEEWRGSGGFDSILAAWRMLADPDARRTFRFSENNDPLTVCRIVDVDSDGRVTLEAPDGQRRSLHAGAVILGED